MTRPTSDSQPASPPASEESGTAASAPPFFTRYGFSRTGRPETPLVVSPYTQICHAGALRATVVASAIDLVGGFFTREIAGTDATFTSDLSLRIPKPGFPTRLVSRGEGLRKGRRLVSTGVTLEEDGEVYAYGQTTFARIPRSAKEAPDLSTLSTPLVIESHPLDAPLAQVVGVEVLSAGDGHVRLGFRPELLNPEGVLQGALIALVAECSALALAEHAGSRQQVVSELDLRYLASAATGPVEARAKWIGPPDARMIAVELRDHGRGSGPEARLTTTALIRVCDPP